jgi:hypothetical protein
MPIFPVFDNAVFGPARTKLMGEAFERAIALSNNESRSAREAMAHRIIEATNQGVSEVDRLVDAALTGTGLMH